MTILIGTHNGQFHCDEALACFMLKQLPEYKQSTIIRSRDPAELDKCDIVVDVGGVYDPAKSRFDHHQRSFNETFSSINPSKPWTIRLSSAGLIYVHFGQRIIEEILKTYSVTDSKLIDILFDRMYENFVKEIDAIDNGVEIADVRRYDITTNLSSRVSYLNPEWNEKGVDENKRFESAMSLVGHEFIDRIRYYALVWWPARSIVHQAIEKRFEIDPSGSIVLLNDFAPWKSHLFDLEKELNIEQNQIKYVLYRDNSDSYRIQCVPVSENSFTNRLSLPAQWCGLRDNSLSTECGIDGCIFVHASGFIGGNKTFEGALKMAQKALNI